MGFAYKNVDLKDKLEVIKKELKASDIIYVNGGNTFYLLDWVRKSDLDKYLGELLVEGKIYLGVSAGSILAGPDIAIAGWDPSWDKNIPSLKDTSGLNLVPFAVSPHFEENERELLERKSKEVNYPVIPITNKQAILVTGLDYKIVGEGDKITLQK